MTMRRSTMRVATALPLLCAGCSGWQSAMDPGGPQAAKLKALIWVFLITCGIIWLLVMLVLAAAVWHRRPPADPLANPLANPLADPATNPSADPLATPNRTASIVVGAAVAASVVVIFGLTLASYFATRGIFDSRPEPLIIQVRGHQWWWEATYKDRSINQNFLTANELHVPVGQPIRIELAADDVIHSFWAPNLTGKQDLIPGRDNALTFTVDKPGTYRQQCAEFCGLQHAHMAMLIVAEPAEAYQNWRHAQLVEPAAPTEAAEQRGRQAFLAKPCAACHTIRGTQASGTLGPDLTHVGSRQYIVAGILPATRGSLAAWIADPQTIKPGNNMPMVPLTADELNDLCAYLASLK